MTKFIELKCLVSDPGTFNQTERMVLVSLDHISHVFPHRNLKDRCVLVLNSRINMAIMESYKDVTRKLKRLSPTKV